MAAVVGGDLPSLVPLPLLLAIAGLALLGVLSQALTQVVTGPLRLGPLVAFAVASSGLSVFGLGPAFWALVFGTVASFVAEPAAVRTAGGAAYRATPS